MQTIKAKKSLGQNFLIDQEALADIANSIEIQGNHIIEVWPGYGALTEYIIASEPTSLDLVELDTDMIKILNSRFKIQNRWQEEWSGGSGGETVWAKKITTSRWAERGGASFLPPEPFVTEGEFEWNEKRGSPGGFGHESTEEEATITLHHKDILTFTPSYDDYSVIANIPYYITSPILFYFLYPKNTWWNSVQNGESEGATLSERKWKQWSDERQQSESEFVDPSGAFGTFQSWKVQSFYPPLEMTIMMQEEVGEKILEGRARKPHHSYLSLAMELACDDIEIVRYVGKESFDPAPKVDSIVLKFTIKHDRNRDREESLLALWRIAFTHPRKTLLSNLRWSHYDIDSIKRWLVECGYDEKVRAEAVKIEDWEKIFETFT